MGGGRPAQPKPGRGAGAARLVASYRLLPMDAIPQRWSPNTENELEQAGSAGLLDEGGGRLEFKREVAAGAPHNRELAKDLASLAVDGGLLLVGVNDVKARPRLFTQSILLGCLNVWNR